MEIVWRQCGESDSFYGDFMVKLAWGFSGVFIYQTISILTLLLKLYERYHSKYYLHTIYIFAVYYRDKIFLQCN